MLNTTRKCPTCGYLTDSVMGVDAPGPPEPGDVSICINCAAVNQFTPAGVLVTAAPDVLADVLTDPRILLTLGWIRAKGLHA